MRRRKPIQPPGLSDAEPGWEAVLYSRYQRRREIAEMAGPIVLLVLTALSWLLLQHPEGPGLKLLGALLEADPEDALDVLMSMLGPAFYLDYLRFVALPVVLGGCLLLPFVALSLRRQTLAEYWTKAIYFYPDRILLVGRRDRVSLPVIAGDAEAPAPSAGVRRLWQKLSRELGTRLQWFFDWSGGELGVIAPPLIGCRLESPSGETIKPRPRRFFLDDRYRRTVGLRKSPGLRQVLRRVLRALPSATLWLSLLVAGLLCGTYCWILFLVIPRQTYDISLAEIEARAEEAAFLRTGILLSGLYHSGDHPEATFEDYTRVREEYLASGGEDLLTRQVQALFELGRGRPRNGLAWLTPDRTGFLEVRLLAAAGETERTWQAAESLGDEPSARNFRALLHLMEGRDREARRLLDPEVENPRSIVLLAALHQILGEAEEAAALLRREEVALWLAEEDDEDPPQTPVEAEVRVRELAYRAIAARLLGEEEEAVRRWREARRFLDEIGLPHLLDGYRRFLWEELPRRSSPSKWTSRKRPIPG